MKTGTTTKNKYFLLAFMLMSGASLQTQAQELAPPPASGNLINNGTIQSQLSQTGEAYALSPTENYSRVYQFKVTYLDGKEETIKSKINIDGKIDFLELKDKHSKTMIYPGMTKQIVKLGPPNEFVGLPNDTSWLFKTTEGKINCYSVVAEKNTQFIQYIQLGNDALMPVTMLKEIVKDNPKAMTAFKKQRYHKAVLIFNSAN